MGAVTAQAPGVPRDVEALRRAVAAAEGRAAALEERRAAAAREAEALEARMAQSAAAVTESARAAEKVGAVLQEIQDLEAEATGFKERCFAKKEELEEAAAAGPERRDDAAPVLAAERQYAEARPLEGRMLSR